jgi:hypothetical protein
MVVVTWTDHVVVLLLMMMVDLFRIPPPFGHPE